MGGGGRGAFALGGGPGGLVGWGGGLHGEIWGAHAPRAKQWSIKGSTYLPLPSM